MINGLIWNMSIIMIHIQVPKIIIFIFMDDKMMISYSFEKEMG